MMSDYRPLDLSILCNVGPEVLRKDAVTDWLR